MDLSPGTVTLPFKPVTAANSIIFLLSFLNFIDDITVFLQKSGGFC